MGGLLGLLETGRESASTMRTRRKFITLRLAGWPLKEWHSEESASLGWAGRPFLSAKPGLLAILSLKFSRKEWKEGKELPIFYKKRFPKTQ